LTPEQAKRKALEEANEQWICRANDVINLKLVNFRNDLENSSKIFRPEFTHQIFPNEKIIGYKGLQINLYYSAGSLTSYLNIIFKEKASFEGDDIQKNLDEYFPKEIIHQPLTNIDEFIKIMETDRENFSPIGEQVHSYTRNGFNDNDTTYEIYKGYFSDLKVKAFHERIQMFILWFIDGSSYIDSEDSNWELYFIFQKRVKNGEKTYSIVGYSTVYNFFCYPDKIRKRISQFLVLPPFQKQGHGFQLLNTIYSCSKINPVQDITVEDPSLQFSRLRNVVDGINLQKEGFFSEKLTTELKPEVMEQIHSKLKLHHNQIKVLHEIFLQKCTKMNDSQEAKTYRLFIKKRLAKKYQDILSGFESSEERKRELQKIYEETESEYKFVISKLK